MRYLLDANVFISAKNLHYGLDFCPAFWEWLEVKGAEDLVFSIESVGDELTAGTDALADWARDRGTAFFRKPEPSWLSALGTVSTWTTSAGYEPAAVSRFFQVADYYLVATALAIHATVVTHERASATKKQVKIPDCIGLGVKCMTPYQMLRHERARFVLGSAT